jgi:hypothetical protein
MAMTQTAAQKRTSDHLKANLTFHMRQFCMINASLISLLPNSFLTCDHTLTDNEPPGSAKADPDPTRFALCKGMPCRAVTVSKNLPQFDYKPRPCVRHVAEAPFGKSSQFSTGFERGIESREIQRFFTEAWARAG